MTKRILALMGVIMMLVLTCVPTYAADGDCGTLSANATKVLKAMYGDGVSAKGTADNDHSYGVSITYMDGSTSKTCTAYLNSRPTVNDTQVKMNAKGQLEVYGMGTGDANTWNQLFAKYKNVIVGVSGIGAITMMALFIIQFMKLGASAGNPQARSQALTGVLWTGIAAALLGAVSIIAGFFYNAI